MNLPDFNTLKRNYPTESEGSTIKRSIGGEVTNSWLGENTCVIRMCKAFNYAGKAYEIPKSSFMKTVTGADGKNYGYRVAEFINFLKFRYGNPSVSSSAKGDDGVPIDLFLKKTGIIVWHIDGWSDARGHFTLWDGQAGVYEGQHSYFNDFKIKGAKRPYLSKAELWIC